ncbi:hypothetical protein FA15DRAFT_759512 [Coprinopsis marcescibilis]|uniref:RRM domain-containing protein n=1 Tax=Coprinopsis marcescibilis TaxID=230819 RepID=A0A5C3KK36_COPMA|nr:hypothetical protein FA15DRAFT_759512 [Coprinopsis marcescibilis]
MDEPITKRIHISGLTTAITADDINKRLSTFGSVKAVEGVGLLDGVGQPRKFGYVTLETTTGKLTRCMNLLSGSTWKGAKLRLGEARPDYAERTALERATADDPPRKRRRQHGTYSSSMDLVTPENVADRGAWKVTAQGRLLRPVRIRPEHPLPPTLEDLAAINKAVKKQALKKGSTEKKKKIKLKAPPTRARSRKIDMTKWGSTQLKGFFLESQAAAIPQNAQQTNETEADSEESDEEGEAEEEEADSSEEEAPPSIPPKKKDPKPVVKVIEPPPTTTAASPDPVSAPKSVVSAKQTLDVVDLVAEKKSTLDLLTSMFADDDEWAGRESVGSDIDEEELQRGVRLAEAETANDFEIVPQDASTPKRGGDHQATPPSEEEEQEVADAIMEDVEEVPEQEENTVKRTMQLKDLFAPRPEDNAFSLLGHLDLDDELDEELAFKFEDHKIATPAAQPQTEYSSFQSSLPSAFTATPATTTYINPKQPLFFPLPLSDDRPYNRQRDPFDVIKDNKWDWADSDVSFYRTKSEDEIRKDWEDKKGDLTRDWKKRAREAGKLSRRRKGPGAGGGDEA